MPPRKSKSPPQAVSPDPSPNTARSGALRVGPAGWSYPDWSGYVYPARRSKGFHEAAYLAEFFDTIEINTSFYQPLRPEHAEQWIDRVRQIRASYSPLNSGNDSLTTLHWHHS